MYLRNLRDLGGDGALRPYSLSLRATWSSERPWLGVELRRRRASSVVIVCHSSEDSSEALCSSSQPQVHANRILAQGPWGCNSPAVVASFAFARGASSFAFVCSIPKELCLVRMVLAEGRLDAAVLVT